MFFRKVIFLVFFSTSLLGQNSDSRFYLINSPLIPQKGNFSCWAATLQMLNKPGLDKFNKTQTPPIRQDSLFKLISNYKVDKFKRISEPSWTKIKEVLSKDKGLVAYKYFNERFAHVFFVKGYVESSNTQWLIVNDPWPVNKGKITALAFNQFLRPFNGLQEYLNMSYFASSSAKDQKSEPAFSLMASETLVDDQALIYLPPKVNIEKKKKTNFSGLETEKLLLYHLELLKNFDPNFFANLNIKYNPKKDALKVDFGSTVNLNQFTNTASFLKYTLEASQNSDYIFDGLRLAFVNLSKNRKPILNLTVELENKAEKPFYYVSRFENYEKSERAEWDQIKEDFEEGLKNPTIAGILNNEIKPKSVPRKGPFLEDNLWLFEENTLEDLSILPLFGGMVYSFTYPPFPEKIVADPHRQLKLKPNREAIFVSDNGTPFYRLSAVGVPEWGEIVAKSKEIPEEWISVESYNLMSQNIPKKEITPTKPNAVISVVADTIKTPPPFVPDIKPDTIKPKPIDIRPRPVDPKKADNTSPVVNNTVANIDQEDKLLDKEKPVITTRPNILPKPNSTKPKTLPLSDKKPQIEPNPVKKPKDTLKVKRN